MRNYWSCSDFADWLRGTPKLGFGTSREWREWKIEAKSKHPVRYWLAETALSRVQSTLCWPTDRLYDAKYYMVNRWVTRTHALTSTQLTRGQWHELDERFLYCLFDELVEYVEVELAWKSVIYDSDAAEKHQAPWWAVGPLRTRTWRKPEAGLQYLEWETTLGLEDPQSIRAREVLTLYHWWKYVRPLRMDPDVESGWAQLCERRRAKSQASGKEYDIFEELEDRTAEEIDESREVMHISSTLQKQASDEDTEMLIRLIRTRQGLWT
jgi:hypothetical protein